MSSLSAPRPARFAAPALLLRHASDERLARLATAGSEPAIAAIFERHQQALHRYCYSILGNGHDAADALQNTMVKALRTLPGETRRIVLRPWLYRVAHNESISLLRTRRPDAELDAAAHVRDEAVAGLLDSRDRLRTLTSDLGELTERQRGALLMRELGGLEFAEVAEALGTTPSAVKQSVYEARCALQAMEEGRAMDCDAIRRAVSDGDGRTLRGARVRGHLRACCGCRDFQTALQERPAQLTALIPPLPVAVAAAMVHGAIGGGAGGGGAGIGIAGTAKVATGISLASKAAAVVAVSATVAGGALVVAPSREPAGGAARTTHDLRNATPAPGGAAAAATAYSGTAAAVARRAARHGAATSHSATPSAPGGGPGFTAGGKPASTPGGKPPSTPGGKPAFVQRHKPAAAAARKPASLKPAAAAARKPVVPARAPTRRVPAKAPASAAGSTGQPAAAAAPAPVTVPATPGGRPGAAGTPGPASAGSGRP